MGIIICFIVYHTDKPTPPCGPLKVSDVTADGCELSWNPPTDDGGMPIDHYAVEKMDPQTGVWTPVGDTFGAETSMKVFLHLILPLTNPSKRISIMIMLFFINTSDINISLLYKSVYCVYYFNIMYHTKFKSYLKRPTFTEMRRKS